MTVAEDFRRDIMAMRYRQAFDVPCVKHGFMWEKREDMDMDYYPDPVEPYVRQRQCPDCGVQFESPVNRRIIHVGRTGHLYIFDDIDPISKPRRNARVQFEILCDKCMEPLHELATEPKPLVRDEAAGPCLLSAAVLPVEGLADLILDYAAQDPNWVELPSSCLQCTSSGS